MLLAGGIFVSLSVEIGKNIVRLRKQKGITQEWLALESEMAVSYLRSIEHGTANPTIDALDRLARVLNVSIESIIDLSGETKDAESYREPMPVAEVLVLPHVVGGFSVCPRCRTTMEREFQSYCDRCGQRLSWDDLHHAKVITEL
jgi:DNA-binding XRE family transcriptional regulator